jgi:competence protein ComEC
VGLLERAPVLPFAASVATGIIALSWLTPPAPSLVPFTGGTLLLAAVALGCRRQRAATLLLLASVMGLGALRGSLPSLPAHHVARQAIPSIVSIEGRLAAEPVRWDTGRTRILLDLDAYHDGPDRRPVEGRVQLTMYGDMEPVSEGQQIRAEVRLHRPIGFRNPGVFDYPAQLRRQGILLVGSGRGDRVTPLSADTPAWPALVKRWAVATIRAQLPESSAALLAGLLLGERTTLPRETDEAFRRAGVYHVLAVSGFNVALIASSVFASLALLGVPRRATAVVAGVVLVGFGLVVGGQPSVVRATVMGLLLLLSALLERDSQVMNALCLSLLLLVAWRPGDLWDPGFQLSFAATAGIIYLAEPFTLFLKERRWPHWLATAVAVSLAAQLPVTPIMLAHFNQLSLIGVAANLLVVPLAGPATTLGMLALLVQLASETAASLLFNALWLLLVALRLAVWAAAAIPGAMVHLPGPSAAAIVAWYGALVLIPHLAGRVFTRVTASALVAAALALSVWPWVSPGDGRLRVTFLDVGQGDATFVELPEGPRILIDGGPGGPRRFDVGERVLSPFLWNRPVGRLDVVALSHSDSDHAGGLGTVLRHFRVREFWESGRWGPGAQDTLAALSGSGAVRRVLRDGQRLWLGRALVTVLNPDNRPSARVNDDSLVLRLDWQGVSLLFTGDLGGIGEARLLERGEPVRILALKVAHHGSRSSSSAAFLESAQPSFAIISVGSRNPFHHPAREALDRLEAAGARVYRTDRDGAVILETDGIRLWITRWARGATEVFDLDPERGSAGAGDAVSRPAPSDPGSGMLPGI